MPMVVKGSYRALAREVGYQEGGDQFRAIRECIERLWTVSIIAQNGRKRQGFRLLSEYASDDAEGRLYVALNPLIAQAVMGGGQHVRISMDEVRALDSEAARLLHQRLCGWIDPGKDRQGGHRYPVRLRLAVRGQWFDHAQAPPAGAGGAAESWRRWAGRWSSMPQASTTSPGPRRQADPPLTVTPPCDNSHAPL